MPSFRDRFLTPQVARAITSPGGIIGGGAVAAAVIAFTPVALPAAALAGAVAGAVVYGTRVALAIPRDAKDAVDLSQLREPWRAYVAEAVDARRRYGQACEGADPGPLRERLVDIGERIDQGVAESWRIARRGMALESALTQLDDPAEVRRRLAAAQGTNDARLAQALQAQLDSTQRIAQVASDTRSRLKLLDARLDEAVARAVELSLRASDVAELGGLGDDVDALVADMEALRQALDETSRSSSAVGP